MPIQFKLNPQRRSTLRISTLLFLMALGTPLPAQTNSYLSARQPDSVVLLAPPPLPGSAEQAADMAAVVAIHGACTSNEAAQAFSEKKFSCFNFTPAIGNWFQSNNLPITTAFMERVQNEAETVTDLAKDYWKRPRPYTVDPSLAAGKLEKSFGYPSGHSTEGTVLALVLAELFPDKQDAIMAVGRDLGWHRVRIARHYPTDIYAGRVFARAIVQAMKSSTAFQHDLAEVKEETAAARQASSTLPDSKMESVANRSAPLPESIRDQSKSPVGIGPTAVGR